MTINDIENKERFGVKDVSAIVEKEYRAFISKDIGNGARYEEHRYFKNIKQAQTWIQRRPEFQSKIEVE